MRPPTWLLVTLAACGGGGGYSTPTPLPTTTPAVDPDPLRADAAAAGKWIGAAIQSGDADRGILICGSGVGASVAANKMRGIRAAICHDTYSAHQGVEHDDMNVLTLGARVVGPEPAFECSLAFLAATFSGQPRHQRRLDKVLAIESEA